MPEFFKNCRHCRGPFTALARSARYCSERCSLAARFERFVDRRGDGSCWAWTGAKKKGYGQLRRADRDTNEGAHRISFRLHIGPIPDGLTVLHTCDNPECTNPRHLFLGTNADNNADCRSKDRHARGERTGGAVLTESQVREIRALRAAGLSHVQVGRRLGVNPHTAAAAANGHSWKHVA